MTITEELKNYRKYRGKCKSAAEKACACDPSLTIVRGHYICLMWGKQQHWWTVRKDGSINDPTKDQFPSGGFGEYVPFDGTVYCDECGKIVPEDDATLGGNGRYAFCSYRCFGKFIMPDGRKTITFESINDDSSEDARNIPTERCRDE